MAKKNRKTLREHFGIGRKPDSDQFTDLIDSMVNIVDDGLSKSAERGLLLSPLDDKGAVMSIRQNILEENPVWVVALGENSELFIRRGEEDQPIVTLGMDGKVILGSVGNNVDLEIRGSIQADRFLGGFFYGKVPANGRWHDIGEVDTGCIGYRVVATCRLKGHLPYSVAEVTAMQCFGNRPRIWNRRSWLGRRVNRIRFRWRHNGSNHRLQVCAGSSYGKGINIHCRISNLLDEFM